MNRNSYILLAAYLALIVSPYVLRRFARAHTDAYGAFAVGRRDFGWFRLCAGLSATFVGGAAVIYIAGLGYTYGWFGLTDALATSTALLGSAVFLVPRLFPQRGFSLGAVLRTSGTLVNATTGLLSTIVYTLVTAAQIVALIKIAQPFLPVPAPWIAVVGTLGLTAYVFYGGYAAVTLTDVIQFIVVGLCYFGLVGVTLVVAPAGPAAVAVSSQTMPLDLLLLLAVPLLFVPASQDLHIRIGSARSQRDARWGVGLAGLVYFTFGLISVGVGRSLARAGVVLASPDDAVPVFLRQHFGTLAIVPTIAVVCVVLASLNSVLFAGASSLAYDFWDRIADRPRDKDSSRPRAATVAVLGAALVIALLAPQVLRLVLSALVIYVSVLLPMLVGRLLGRRAGPVGWLAISVLAGVTSLEACSIAPPFRLFVYTFVHLAIVLCLKKESAHAPPH